MGMNNFVDQRHQRQYSANIKKALQIRSLPTIMNNSNQYIHYLDSPNESAAYSNATHLLHLRSDELDRVKKSQNLLNQFQEFQVTRFFTQTSTLPSPTLQIQSALPQQAAPPPPPPPYKQEHLTTTACTQTPGLKGNNRPGNTENENNMNRIRSYNEAANIFKIKKIHDSSPDFYKPTQSLTNMRSDNKEKTDKRPHQYEIVNTAYCMSNEHNSGNFN